MGKILPSYLILALALLAQDAPPPADAGRAAYYKGDYGEALSLLEKAWQPCLAPDTKDPACYETARLLARVLAGMSRPSDAESYLQMAITFRETHLDRADPVKQADELMELARLCRAKGEYERGITVIQRAIPLHYQASNQEQTLQVADDYSWLAQLYLDAKKPEMAVSQLRRAVALRVQLLGSDSPGLLPDLDRLGGTLVTERDYPGAEEVFRRALVIRERLFGPVSAELLSTLDGLAYALYGQKNYDQAEPYYKRLLSVWETSAGPDHPMVATVLDKMALFYREQQKLELGADFAARAIATRQLFLAGGLVQEATQLLALNNLEAAARRFEQAHAALDPARPEHATALGKLTQVLADMKRPVPAAAPPAPVRAKKGGPSGVKKGFTKAK